MSRRPVTLLSKRSSAYTLQPEVSVILELAEDGLRAGLSGESEPRCHVALPPLDTADLGVCEDLIEQALRKAVNRFLFLELKNKRVCLVEQHYLCIKLKQVLARVVFTYHQARELQFLSGSVCALLPLARQHGLVLSVDLAEITAVPVFDLRPLNKFVRTTILAGNAVGRRARYLLETYAQAQTLSETDLAAFLSQAAVCLPRSPLTTPLPNLIDDTHLEALYAAHAPTSTLAWQQPSSQVVLQVPQWIRMACFEVLFEGRSAYADYDERALPFLIQEALRASPIDVRPHLNTIILTGSLCQVKGLALRLAKETGLAVAENVFGPNLAWAGASLAADLKYEGPALLMTAFNNDRRVPDWSKGSAP